AVHDSLGVGGSSYRLEGIEEELRWFVANDVAVLTGGQWCRRIVERGRFGGGCWRSDQCGGCHGGQAQRCHPPAESGQEHPVSFGQGSRTNIRQECRK